ncbi:LacI family DNA-binding transcriptional regulator [Botrimarina sp.]|uniref:LacI family DNA-binding transcriptional regulator n=1 Tax=Botrimarina sp. TaxID=2795802 RepID=UPI0032EDBE88
MASIRQVAKEAGVSTATVSRVLNGHTSVGPDLRDRVLHAANRCDYAPTVGKRTAERIALLYAGDFWLESPYDSACVVGLSRAMRKSPYDLVLLDHRRDRHPNETLKQFFSRKGVCGAVIRSTLEFRGQLAAMAEEDVPLVVLGDHFNSDRLRFAYADSLEASREAMEHLLALGHTRIAFLGCDRDDGDHLDRLQAYRDVLGQAGLLCESDIHRVPPYRMDGAPVARRLLSRPDRPTALFIADPLVAVGVINEAHSMGVRLPADLSVVGFDDSDTRMSVFPRMTAVCQDSALLGETAFAMLCDLIDLGGPFDAAPEPQTAWFEIHETTGPAPQAVAAFLPGSRSGATRARAVAT